MSILREEVWQRARGICEYCRMSQEFEDYTFHLDHIRPVKHDGPDDSENLALCCPRCSLYKGANAAGFDPETDELTPLFNPRTQVWTDHFAWNGAVVVGQTTVGRSTIQVMRINLQNRIEQRQALIDEGVFPPGDG